jgi:hypothetical protein
LSPDCTNDQWRIEAFHLFKMRELMLRPREKDFKFSGTMPSTVEELLKRKKTKTV